jgi:hypothetical protein
MNLKNKRGAMEMSIGTIVTVVLSMTLLIGGIVLIRSILNSSNDVVDLTDSQVKNQINQLFGDNSKLVMYPDSREINIDVGEDGAFAFGIQNLLRGSGQNTDFTYEVSVSDSGNCGLATSDLDEWIILGKSGSAQIAQGGTYSVKTKLAISEMAPLCTFRVQVIVNNNGALYASDSMDIQITS